jgi:uncharacterized membrane protein YecN with MAPEG domain
MPAPVTAILTAVLGLLLVGLSLRISALRMRHRISLGDGGNPEVLRAVRAHGNTAEHVPIFLLLALVYELTEGSSQFLIVVAAVFVLTRGLYTIGLLGRGFHQLRMLGALLTYLSQAALALGLLWSAVAAH